MIYINVSNHQSNHKSDPQITNHLKPK